MANSYGVNPNTKYDYPYGVYDTINGEWSGTWFKSYKDAEEWVKTQDDKSTETGEDWTEGGTALPPRQRRQRHRFILSPI